MALGPPDESSTEPATRIHRIADGDTLESLARRYLGDEALYLDIYDANRYVLPGPEMLPIGVELKIPPRREPMAPSLDDSPSHAPLVPIRP